MAHPHNEHRAHHVERRRVHELTGHHQEKPPIPRAKGGRTPHDDEAEDRKLFGKMLKEKHLSSHGGRTKHRVDKRARGGKVKHKGSHTTNVIIAGHGGPGGGPPSPTPVLPAAAPPPGLGAAPPAPPMPPRPPMMPPGMAPQAGPGGPPLIRKRGGRASHKGSKVFEEGRKHGTQPMGLRGKGDGADIGRKSVITKKHGGRAKHHADGGGATTDDKMTGTSTNTANIDRGKGGILSRLGDLPPADKRYKLGKAKGGSIPGLAHGGHVDPTVSRPVHTAPVHGKLKVPDEGPVHPVMSPGKHAIYAPPTGTQTHGYTAGSHSGEGRLQKMHRAERGL